MSIFMSELTSLAQGGPTGQESSQGHGTCTHEGEHAAAGDVCEALRSMEEETGDEHMLCAT